MSATVSSPAQDGKLRLLLINPNTSAATTDLMLGIACRCAAAGVEIGALTAPFGAALITDEQELATAAEAVVAAVDGLSGGGPDGIIVSAFGDPGLDALRQRTSIPAVGLAEASMFEAAAGGRRFSVATTTPDLVAAIERCAARYGLAAQLRSVRTTSGDIREIMADRRLLPIALERVARQVIEEDGAEAVIIGGGPLAEAARSLAAVIPVPVIEPIPAAVRLLQIRCGVHA